MKTILKTMLAVALFSTTNYLQAQAPQGVNYQATIRDASGNLMTNQSVDVIFNVVETSASGNVIYSESQTLTTNAYGGFSAIIGQGTPTTGTFNTIDWGSTPLFLNVLVDGNDLGTTEFNSVPYALYAEKSNKSTLAEGLTNPIWKKRQVNGDYFTEGKRVIIGDSLYDADALTVSIPKTTLTAEVVDFKADTLTLNADILNLYAGTVMGSIAQFIECNKQGDGIVFKVNTDGTVYAKRTITTGESLKVGNEINATTTGTANMIPIAYGSVNMNGSVGAITNNVSVTHPSTGEYRIDITNETFNLSDYVVIISVQYGAVYSNVAASAGKTVVHLKSFSGTATDASFHFAIYKP